MIRRDRPGPNPSSRPPRFEPGPSRGWERRCASWASRLTQPPPSPPCSSCPRRPDRARGRTRPRRALEADKQVDAALKAYSVVQEKFPKSNQGPQAGLAAGATARPGWSSGRLRRGVRAFEQ